jgi:hypothetical protein
LFFPSAFDACPPKKKEKNLHKAAVLAFLIAASLMLAPRFVAPHPSGIFKPISLLC